MTKFRLIKRARGWVVQRPFTLRDEHNETGAQCADYNVVVPGKWHTIATYRWRFFASLHLTLLREMNRK